MNRSVEELGPDPPAWWRRGQRCSSRWPQSKNTLPCRTSRAWQQNPLVTNQRQAGDGAGDGAGCDKPAEPRTKRRKTHMPPKVKEWFRSLTRVKADCTAFAYVVFRVCSRVCCGAGVLAELLNALLETLGVHYRFSTRQSRKLMRSLGFSFKKPNGELGKEWPAATTRTFIKLCQQKIEWTLNDAPITDRSRIINIDETCCKMLPLLERRWLAGGEQHVVMDTRRNITVFLVTRHLESDVYAQLIFLRARPPPWNPPTPTPSLLTTSHSESHWTTPATLTAFLPHMAGHHCHEPRWPHSPMDLPRGRVYRARQSGIPDPRAAHARIWLVFVSPNTTAVCQPLDRSYMRPFKAALGRTSARYVDWEIQHHPDDIANITHSIAGLRSLLMTWTHDALQEIATMHHNTASVSGIVCSLTEQPEVLALATSLAHSSGITAATSGQSSARI